jgi:hypothetical protein
MTIFHNGILPIDDRGENGTPWRGFDEDSGDFPSDFPDFSDGGFLSHGGTPSHHPF